MIWLLIGMLVFSSGIMAMEPQVPSYSLLPAKQLLFGTINLDVLQKFPIPPLVEQDEQCQYEEFEYVGPRLTLYDAVLHLNDACITQCLMDGASLQVQDHQGMTIFHHLAKQNVVFQKSILKALLLTPRLYVINTVRTMSPKGKRMYPRLMKWHIAGLVKVLSMSDKKGNIPFEYAQQDSLWRYYFYPDPKLLKEICGPDIMVGYINKCAGEDN